MRTEDVNQRFQALDTWESYDIANALIESQLSAAAAVHAHNLAIASAADASAKRLENDEGNPGRLIYVGAGASGRIGVQDGVELYPTYGWPHDRLVYLMAGGSEALTDSVEGAEDDIELAEQEADDLALHANDVMICIAASGKTPYTIKAAEKARDAGALVIGIANNPNSPLAALSDFRIDLHTGAEVIAGSTRMAAGTAQKIALNILSTLIMVRLNRVYDNLMVDLSSSNTKLNLRRIEILQRIVPVSTLEAKRHLETADQKIKVAALLCQSLSKSAAEELLQQHKGNLRAALQSISQV